MFTVVVFLNVAVGGGDDEQYWLQVLKPRDVSYTYKIRPAKNFGAVQPYSFRNIKLVPSDPPDACSQVLKNGAKMKNEAVLILRGGCSFVSKALNAEMYGAAAVIISDNEMDASSWIDMIGDGTQREHLVAVSVYFMRGRDGMKIRQSIARHGMDGAFVNVPVNRTNSIVVLNQPPWDPW